MVISLRFKITLSLLLMSVFCIALIAFSAKHLIRERFEALAHDPVADSFMQDVIAYYDYYGSWETALGSELLVDFVLRMRASGELPEPEEYPEGRQPFVFYQRPGVAIDFTSAEEEPANSELINPEIPDTSPPPYIVIDNLGVIILSPVRADIGRKVPGLQLEHSIPVIHDNQIIGYLYSDLRAALSEQRGQYLEAINGSWWAASILAIFLSLPLGYVLGHRIASPIDSIDRAMRAMQPGSLNQRVAVRSKDELGLLAESFNQMSKDLAYAYTELEKSREQMQQMSLHDPLTQLANRRSFDESASFVLAQARRHNRPCSLAMLDIDRFKRINDTYSHSTGDKVLKELANILSDNLRKVDILARYGGEEFLVLFPETALPTAYKLVERLRKHIAQYQWPELDPELQLTVSCGIVEVDINDTEPNTLDRALNAADKMLYLAKEKGRNRTEI